MHPGSTRFRRFDYRSHLSKGVQARMVETAIRFVFWIGFDNRLFSIEMMVNSVTGALPIIEVNPRMSPLFANAMEKVGEAGPAGCRLPRRFARVVA
jgi:hypothetical protein